MLGLIKEERIYILKELKELFGLYWQKFEKYFWDWILVRVLECKIG